MDDSPVEANLVASSVGDTMARDWGYWTGHFTGGSSGSCGWVSHFGGLPVAICDLQIDGRSTQSSMSGVRICGVDFLESFEG